MVVCALLLHFTSPEHGAWKFKSPAWGFPCLWLTRHKSREERRESCVFPSDYFKLEIQEKTKWHPAQADLWGRSPCYVAQTQGHLWSVRNLYHLQSLRGPLLARAHWLRVAASRGQRPPSRGLSCPFPAAPLRAKQPASGGTGHHLWAGLGLSSLLFPPRGVPDPCARRKQGPLVQAWAK